MPSPIAFRTVPAVLAGIALVAAGEPSVVRADVYWLLTLSESPTECSATYSEPFTGERTLYLTMCGGADRAFEFGLESTFEEVVSIVPSPGVQLEGTLDSMVLCVPQPADPFVVATVVVNDTDGSGGSLCFVPSDRARICHADNCADLNWTSAFWTTMGYTSDPAVPLCFGEVTDCGPNPVWPWSWGRTKSQYR